MSALQQFINTSPGLAVLAAFIIGVAVFLALRIVLSSFGCLVRLAVAIAIGIGIVLLLRTLLAR